MFSRKLSLLVVGILALVKADETEAPEKELIGAGFVNWSENVRFAAQKVVTPSSAEEIEEIVKQTEG